MKRLAVAIDGPSGAGKSTIARAVAAEIGYIYVDTGALYRAIGLAAHRAGIPDGDTERIVALLPSIHLSLTYAEGTQRVLLNGEDVSNLIRVPEISRYASQVSVIPAVRQFLLTLQRDMAAQGGVIMDGRDIGTVILPNAEVKIFLTASAEKRAQRRFQELMDKGESVTFQQVLQDMRQRDAMDEGRETAPLQQAQDAILLDTSTLDLPQSIAQVRELITKKMEGQR